jgi:hypothetical protein
VKCQFVYPRSMADFGFGYFCNEDATIFLLNKYTGAIHTICDTHQWDTVLYLMDPRFKSPQFPAFIIKKSLSPVTKAEYYMRQALK